MGRIWRAFARGAGGEADQHGAKNGLDSARIGATSMSETGGQAPASELPPDERVPGSGEGSSESSGAAPAPADGMREIAKPEAASGDSASTAGGAPPGSVEVSVPTETPATEQPAEKADGAPAGLEADASAAEPARPVADPAGAGAAGQSPAATASGKDGDTVPLAEASTPQDQPALQPGSVVAGRFTVLRELSPESATTLLGGPVPADVTALYAVEDRVFGERCWACGSTHNDAHDAKQRFCVDCGAPRQQEWVLAQSALPTGTQDELAYAGAYYRVLHRRKQFGSSGMAVEVGACSLEGPHHPNEDSYWTAVMSGCFDSRAEAVCVAVLADGMGGYAPGSGLISKAIVSTVGSHIFERVAVERATELTEAELRVVVREAIAEANGKVLDEISRHGEMGSTLVVALVYGRVAYVANIGDSRAYYVSPSSDVSQVTRDQSLVQQQVLLGLMPADAMFTAAGNNVILHAVGEERVEELFDWYVQDLEPDSYMILCTDGYWKTMRHDVWTASSLGRETSLHNLAGRLAQTAVDQSSDDNTTVVVIGVA